MFPPILLAATSAAFAQNPDRSGRLHAVIQPDGSVEYFTLSGQPDKNTGSKAGEPKFGVLLYNKTFGAEISKNRPAVTYAVTDESGNVAGYWIGTGSEKSAAALSNVMDYGWGTKKLGVIKALQLSPVTYKVPVPKEKFIEELRTTMLDQAFELACKSRVRPREISVTASLAASVSLIVGGEGTISFAATWETDRLCVGVPSQ